MQILWNPYHENVFLRRIPDLELFTPARNYHNLPTRLQ